GDRLQSARCGVPACLGGRILRERLRILGRFRGHRVEIARRDKLEVEAPEYFAVLAELPGVRRAQKDRVPLLCPASHTSMVALAATLSPVRRYSSWMRESSRTS